MSGRRPIRFARRHQIAQQQQQHQPPRNHTAHLSASRVSVFLRCIYKYVYIYIYICHIICWVQEGERGAERTRELKSIIGAWPRVTFGLKYYNYKRTPAGKARRKVNRSWSSGVEHWHRIASLAWLTTTLKQKSAAWIGNQSISLRANLKELRPTALAANVRDEQPVTNRRF